MDALINRKWNLQKVDLMTDSILPGPGRSMDVFKPPKDKVEVDVSIWYFLAVDVIADDAESATWTVGYSAATPKRWL